jgi:pimeloyl-ACP methyl ester carboxylesterase/DNA-binding CsgD family transcriptional regulator
MTLAPTAAGARCGGYRLAVIPELRHARTTDGVDIAWTSIGHGPPLIHMPGVPFSNIVAEWGIPAVAANFERLGERVRFIQYDGRGTGHSQRDVAALDLEAMIGDLEAVLDAAGLAGSPVTLFGFYHSVTAAIAFAARHPDRVRGLVLFGGAARGWLPMSGSETQALLTLIERDWNAFVESIAHAWLGWDVSPEEGRLAVEWFRTASSPALARATLQAASLIDVTPLLAAVRCPVLVLHRRDARVISLATSEELAASLLDARLEILPGAAASLFFEDADDVVHRLADFAGARPRPTEHPASAVQVGGPTAGTGHAGPTSDTAERTNAGDSATASLSAREVDVLRLIAAGESNGEIGRRLGITVNTVERHAVNLYRKIDARGRADAAAFAIRHGLA